eukprot:TRINITY_DN4194_c2_g1_i2.p1 TRINITY_DN4194_c2_g1~~TRINITY_DN4194_c2_g1_i2.p1  ORF type:complete len:172 (+),score=25.72 TRINITY_DN4194_c2_g1_i2:188-703(+)
MSPVKLANSPAVLANKLNIPSNTSNIPQAKKIQPQKLAPPAQKFKPKNTGPVEKKVAKFIQVLPVEEPKIIAVPKENISHNPKPPVSESKEGKETDAHRIDQRMKQINLGKNTVGYQRYITLVPRNTRKAQHPKTPDVTKLCSKRSWDGQVRKWRRELHEWDPPGMEKKGN